MFQLAWPSSASIKYKILGGLIATVGFRDFISISKTNCCNNPPSILYFILPDDGQAGQKVL